MDTEVTEAETDDSTLGINMDLDEEEVPASNPHQRGQVNQKVKYVSAWEFTAFRIARRPISEKDPRTYFWQFGRLCHQYIVDNYAKIEGERLNWCKFNQDHLRAHLFQGIQDAIAAGDIDGA